MQPSMLPPDLPPPPAQTDSHRRRRNEPLAGGVFLVVLGTGLLIAQSAPDLGQYVPLAIGLGLLAVFLVTRSYGALVGGSILSGVGVGVVLAVQQPDQVGGAAVLISLAGGFLFISIASYLFQLPERHLWPIVPAAILGSIGGALLLGNTDLVATYWPVILIAIGAVLVLIAFARRGEAAS